MRIALAAALTGLSDALWAAYADPASDDQLPQHSPVDDGATNKDLNPAQLLHAHWEPNLPEDEYLQPERFHAQAQPTNSASSSTPSPTRGSATRWPARVEAEVAAVEQAETWYFVDHAAQAILMTCVYPSPAQVDATFDALQANLFDKTVLDRFDPPPHLIEDLLESIGGAFQVWEEHDDPDPPLTRQTMSGMRVRRRVAPPSPTSSRTQPSSTRADLGFVERQVLSGWPSMSAKRGCALFLVSIGTP